METTHTFERKHEKTFPKERFGWIHNWCDNENDHDKPRILLIGDSIVCGYQQKVRNLLSEECYVDYVATSYSTDEPFYKALILGMVKRSCYDFVFFNFGLHGGHLGARSYRAQYGKILKEILKHARALPVTSTRVLKKGTARLDPAWRRRVDARNAVMVSLAEELGLPLLDLYAVTREMPASLQGGDGIHFTDEGYTLLAEAVAAKARELLS